MVKLSKQTHLQHFRSNSVLFWVVLMKFFLVDFRRLHTNIDIPIADIYIKLKTDEITAEELPTDVRKVSSSVQLF